MLAVLVGNGCSSTGNAGGGTGRLSMNGRVAGLVGVVVPHSTGGAGHGAPAASTWDFFEVMMAAAPTSAPLLMTVRRSSPSRASEGAAPGVLPKSACWCDIPRLLCHGV